MKNYAVLGLGRFGRSVAKELMDSGAQVLAADNDENLIEKYAGQLTYAMTADLSNAEDIASLGLSNMDAVIVSMARCLEASIMCVMTARECGVPLVIAKAKDHIMGQILTRVGADRIIYPEEESGIRVARKLISGRFIEFFDLSDNLCIIEMIPKKEWIGHTLSELRLRQKEGINVIGIRQDGGLNVNVDPAHPIEADIPLWIITDKSRIYKFNDH